MDKPRFTPGHKVMMLIANRLWRFYFMTLVGLLATYWFAAIFREPQVLSLFSLGLWEGLFRAGLMLGCLSWAVMVFVSISDR